MKSAFRSPRAYEIFTVSATVCGGTGVLVDFETTEMSAANSSFGTSQQENMSQNAHSSREWKKGAKACCNSCWNFGQKWLEPKSLE
eukprot:CAMPEP_0203987548 /NCGR_PEP_ID=MMETSP0360-20130528/6837_1 /ASSEMBLY_ACC=CAM_ASM_000342 /TAXON_ID=268821 /ORGANISM="Scrippsiella Hangoei, Strain SHTV-5" /LENGTH=85 /DNA_ID=CAMNT_0050927197 /DNA_START=116 /DNA_END=370 /DNA_ORIENTATION=-